MILKPPKLTEEEKRQKALEKNRAWNIRSVKKQAIAPKKPVNNGFYNKASWTKLASSIKARGLINMDSIEGWICACCGVFVDKEHSQDMHVSHVLPRAEFKHLALEPDNLLLFCKGCNKGYDNDYSKRRKMIEYVKLVKGVNLLDWIDKSNYLFGGKK